METNFQKIQKIIADVGLSQEEQNDFLVFLMLVQDKGLDPVLQLFSEDKNWVKKIYQNIKSKQEALSNQNSQLWQNIVKEEEALLQGEGK